MKKTFALFLVASLCSATLFAQHPSLSDSMGLTIRFGPYRDEAKALAEDFKKLLNAEIIVTDSAGTKWKVIEYNVGWRRREASDDTRTGVRKNITTYSAEKIEDSTRLTAIWQKQLKENLKSGEVISFEDVWVEHPTKHYIRRLKPMRIQIL